MVNPTMYEDEVSPDKNRFYIGVPYHSSFIKRLKELVPGRNRSWHPNYRMWHVDRFYWPEVLHLCEETFGKGNVVVEKYSYIRALNNSIGRKPVARADLYPVGSKNITQSAIEALKAVSDNSYNIEEEVTIVIQAWKGRKLSEKEALNLIEFLLNIESIPQ